MNTSPKDIKSSFYKPVKARFYILFAFSTFACLNGFLWNTWQPIMQSLTQIFKWNLTRINLLLFMPGITYCILIFPITYIWSKSGIRSVYYCCSICVVIGTFIPLYPGSLNVQAVLIPIGSTLSSVGAVVAMVGAPVISSIWFPSEERSLATATALSFNMFGSAFSPLIGSLLVPDLPFNHSSHILSNSTAQKSEGLHDLLYLQCSLAMFCIALILVYFPEKPIFPPCRSSEKFLRIDFWSGFRSLRRNKQFGIVFILNFIVYGMNVAMAVVFTSFILPLGISQKEVGVLNTVCAFIIFFAALFGGWLGNRIKYKKIVLLTTVPSILMYIVLGLQTSKWIPYDLRSVYIVNTIVSFVANIVCPITFEMGCEAGFPVSEEISTAVLGLATNAGMSMFIAITMIPNIGTVWIPYSYATMLLLIFPLMCFYEDKSKRQECNLVTPRGLLIGISNDSAVCPMLHDE